jgi:hypothetical protein
MLAADLRASAATEASPPAGLTAALSALWHAAHGDWERAHEFAQGDRTADGSWVHAYLHRQEGDAGNAAYWYSRAGKSVSKASLDDEWTEIARTLLAASSNDAPGTPPRAR